MDLGQLLMDMKLIEPVEVYRPFSDDKTCYKWTVRGSKYVDDILRIFQRRIAR